MFDAVLIFIYSRTLLCFFFLAAGDHIKEQLIDQSNVVSDLKKDINIRYFKLPENNGWNSGRAVLLSQVQTEYFVSCDDDFIFNKDTRIGTNSSKCIALYVVP